MADAKQIAIIGASGYTGAELIRLVSAHPEMDIAALGANAKAGQAIADVFPQFLHLDLPRLTRVEEIDFERIDLAFCAVPHGTSHELVAALPASVKVIDLSAGFRLRDVAAYEKWYHAPHAAPALQAEAVYGLTEFYRNEIRHARLVAGTGCNAAACQYALVPALAAGVIDPDDIILDLKVGFSGAGRAVKENLLYAEGADGVSAYALGSTHRHLGELDQELPRAAGRPVEVSFTPHLIPASRGIMVSAWVRGEAGAIHHALTERYAPEPFVHMLPLGQVPRTQSVRGSNHVQIGVVQDRRADRALIVTVLDNLTKGSSGQALQNANLMLGLEETSGLLAPGMFP